MTEEEFKQAVATGQVKEVNVSAEANIPATDMPDVQPKLDDYIVYLEQLRRGEIGGGMDLVQAGTFTNTVTISGLNGDKDGVYRLIIRTQHSVAHYIYLKFNNDSGANYKVNQHLFGRDSATAIHTHYQEDGATALKIIAFSRKQHWVDVLIYAKSGIERMVVGQDFAYTDYDNMYGVQATGLWTNTADNLTSITISTGVVTNGEYRLYKLKNT